MKSYTILVECCIWQSLNSSTALAPIAAYIFGNVIVGAMEEDESTFTTSHSFGVHTHPSLGFSCFHLCCAPSKFTGLQHSV